MRYILPEFLCNEDAEMRLRRKNQDLTEALNQWEVANTGHGIKLNMFINTEDMNRLTFRIEGGTPEQRGEVMSLISRYYSPIVIRPEDLP